ncbi:response regulator [Catenovulum agarivorans]|uniref:response regulator n=1 Tax=Catenovulum agarivorans TaxID=1172192 RepID=UPI0004AD88F5|nr:response regulator [Catenovulum agarivorans]
MNKIIFVEDNDIDFWSVERIYNKSGMAKKYNIYRFTSAEECIEYMENLSVNTPIGKELFFIDLNLPSMSGHKLIERLRKIGNASTILVALSSSTHNTDIEKSYQAGANAYIVKHEKYDEFAEALLTTTKFWMEVALYA